MSLFKSGCDCQGLCGGQCPEWRRAFMMRVLAGVTPALLLVLVLMLGGCAAPAAAPEVLTRVQVQRVTLPAGLLHCEDEPRVTGYALQSQVADYIVRLHEAYEDCHDDVAAIAQTENSSAGR
ncbi:MAG: hypothetical protein ACLGP3_10430 [Acidobacteriota bacterium]